MTPISYKGFTLCFSLTDGADSRIHVTPGEGFNPLGYANVNTAKGAVTKHLTAQSDAADAEAAAAHFGTPAEALVAFRDMGEPVNVVKAERLLLVDDADDIREHSTEIDVGDKPLSGPTGAYLPREDATQGDPSLDDPDGPQWIMYARDTHGNPIAGNPKWASMYAHITYYGIDKGHDKRSRNKREGKYAGCIGRRHFRSTFATGPGLVFTRVATEFFTRVATEFRGGYAI